MAHTNPELRRAYNREYYKNRFQNDPDYKKKHIARVKLNTDRYRLECVEIVSQFRKNGCSVCDEKDPSCMDAHHIDPSQKSFDIGNSNGVSPKNLIEELKKCVCLCANCHRKFHAGVISITSVVTS